METWDAINAIRVVRKFTDQPLEPEHLERILNAGRRAASSKNEQTWAFIVVTDRGLLKELTAVGRYADHLAGAAAAIALVTPDESGPHIRTTMWDMGRAAQNMVLAAWELGIGSASGDGAQPQGGGSAAWSPRGPPVRLPALVRLPRGRCPSSPPRTSPAAASPSTRSFARTAGSGDRRSPAAARCLLRPLVISHGRARYHGGS